MNHKYLLFCLIVIIALSNFSLCFAQETVIFDEENIIDTEEYPLQINLQYADEDDLKQLPFLAESDIRLIINYRNKAVIVDRYSLRDAGLTHEKIELLLPYLVFSKTCKLNSKLESIVKYNRLNDEFKELNYYSVHYNCYSILLQKEFSETKGSSEKFFGFSLTGYFKKTKLVIGEYKLQNAYGLLFSKNSFLSEKAGFDIDFSKTGANITPTAKDRFSRNFMGVAVENKINNRLSFIVFSSNKPIGVRLKDDKIDKITLNDLDPTDKINYFNFGCVSLYKSKNYHQSILLNFNQYENSFLNSNYKDNDISFSISNSYDYSEYRLFLEFAHAHNSSAFLGGIRYNKGYFKQIFAFRYIAEMYFSEYANFLCENLQKNNEQGLFYKVEIKNHSFGVKAYADIFQNLEPIERYADKKIGTAYGVKYMNFKLLRFDTSIKQKFDQDWRSFDIVSKLYDRKRTYYNLKWYQLETKQVKTNLNWYYQIREYPQKQIVENAYLVNQSIKLEINRLQFDFGVGVFDTEMPLYYYDYSGRYNNFLQIINGEGYFSSVLLRYSFSGSIHTEASYRLMVDDKYRRFISFFISLDL